MIFDLGNQNEIDGLKEYLNRQTKKGSTIEINVKSGQRTVDQNKYLHVLLGIIAVEYGESIEYVKKHIYKGIINSDIFTREAKTESGEIQKILRSSSDLSKDEMTKSIDKMKDYAMKEMEVYLPEANEKEMNGALKFLDKNSNYLY